MPTQREERALQALASSRCSGLGCGNNNQQKNSQCCGSQPLKTPNKSLVAGFRYDFARELENEHHRPKRGCRPELAGFVR